MPRLNAWKRTGHAVEAPVCGHPREAEKVSATGAGRLRECVNTEFVWARVQTVFCQCGRKKSCPLTRVSARPRELRLCCTTLGWNKPCNQSTDRGLTRLFEKNRALWCVDFSLRLSFAKHNNSGGFSSENLGILSEDYEGMFLEKQQQPTVTTEICQWDIRQTVPVQCLHRWRK